MNQGAGGVKFHHRSEIAVRLVKALAMSLAGRLAFGQPDHPQGDRDVELYGAVRDEACKLQ